MSQKCNICGGSGWKITERNGISGAARCECAAPAQRPPDRRPTIAEIGKVVQEVATSKIIPFFPQEVAAWKIIAAEIANFVTDCAALKLFARMIVRHAPDAYQGIAWFRKVYCLYATPADGIYPGEALPGYSNAQCEMRALIADQEAREHRVDEYQQALTASGQRPEPFALPEPRMLR